MQNWEGQIWLYGLFDCVKIHEFFNIRNMSDNEKTPSLNVNNYIS